MPGKKALRVTTACDACRNKRVKCDGKNPVCTHCQTNKLECTYTQKSKKRGLPTGYIHNLEHQVVVLRALFGKIMSYKTPDAAALQPLLLEMLSESSDLKNTLKPSLDVWDQSSVQSALASFANTHKDPIVAAKADVNLTLEPQVKTLPPSDLPSEELSLQALPSALSSPGLLRNTPAALQAPDPALGLGLNSPSLADFAFVNINYDSLLSNDIFHYAGEDADEEVDELPVTLQYHGLSQHISGFSRATIYKYNTVLGPGQKNPFRVGTIFDLSSSTMDTKFKPAGQVKVPLEIFRFPPSFRQYVDSYFQMYHPWVPMLDRIQTIRHVARFQERAQSEVDLNLASVIALIWAIMALERVGDDARSAHHYARNSILALENAPITTIESIQAAILLGLYFYKAGDWDNSWVLVSSATRMAIDVRLMRPIQGPEKDPAAKSFSSFDNTSRERTWATVYVVNTLLAARMGRSPLVRASDWPVPTISDDGWEEWESCKSLSGESQTLESGRCLSIFNQFLKVASLLNTALTCSLDTYGSAKETEAGSKKLTLAFFKTELDNWRAQLPPHCQVHVASSPMVSYLHLCSNIVWCVVSVRLMHLKDDFHVLSGATVETRNQEFTAACVSTRDILDLECSKLTMEYPFMDYFLLMAFNFPSMLVLSPVAAAGHTSRMAELLQAGSKHSVPFQITWELYQLENGMEKKEEFTAEAPETAVKDEKVAFDPSVFHFFNNSHFSLTPKFDLNGRQRFSAYSQNAPKEELDLFMLDTDFAKSDGRRDKFMKNLGVINNESDRLLGSRTNSFLNGPALAMANSDFENLPMNDYDRT